MTLQKGGNLKDCNVLAHQHCVCKAKNPSHYMVILSHFILYTCLVSMFCMRLVQWTELHNISRIIEKNITEESHGRLDANHTMSQAVFWRKAGTAKNWLNSSNCIWDMPSIMKIKWVQVIAYCEFPRISEKPPSMSCRMLRGWNVWHALYPFWNVTPAAFHRLIPGITWPFSPHPLSLACSWSCLRTMVTQHGCYMIKPVAR